MLSSWQGDMEQGQTLGEDLGEHPQLGLLGVSHCHIVSPTITEPQNGLGWKGPLKAT